MNPLARSALCFLVAALINAVGVALYSLLALTLALLGMDMVWAAFMALPVLVATMLLVARQMQRVPLPQYDLREGRWRWWRAGH